MLTVTLIVSGVDPEVLERTIQLPTVLVLEVALQFMVPELADTPMDCAAGFPPVLLAKVREDTESVRLAL